MYESYRERTRVTDSARESLRARESFRANETQTLNLLSPLTLSFVGAKLSQPTNAAHNWPTYLFVTGAFFPEIKDTAN